MTKQDNRQAKQRIIFRADGNSRIGLGHVTRSLALAAMLQDEFECVFAIQMPEDALSEQLLDGAHGIISLPVCEPAEERFLHELDAYISEEEIVVLDGYHFGTAYQENIKARGTVLVCIDDIHADRFVADAVINPAGGVALEKYKTAPYTKLYLGPAYALLRQPFLEAAKTKSSLTNPEKKRIFLCLGGADPENNTLRIAREIQQLDASLELEIVVGSAYKDIVSLNQWLLEHDQHQLHQNLTADALCNLMQSCPIAITSASGVAYEYAATGGALFILQTASNQSALYQYLLSSGMALDYGTFASVFEAKELEALAANCTQHQQEIFDGLSGERLKSVFRFLSLQVQLTVRTAAQSDLQTLFDWANDPVVRSHSFNSNPIALETHNLWLDAKLQNPDSVLYMVEANGEPAAHIRFEITKGNATISYLIAEGYRGKGLGHTVLQKGIRQLRKDRKDVRFIDGLVQKSNLASIRAFEKAGFSTTDADPLYPNAVRFKMEVR